MRLNNNYTYIVSPIVSISTRVPIAEAEFVGFIASSLENSNATSTVLTVYQFGISAQSGFYLLFAYVLIALFLIDL
ncbi:hypothetical protein HUE58_05910 [Candidatus Ruthia endofausta]|uniref:Uncharacterized protein n=1 Tax=Candidatus Ruthia endofausta TaxID=2738852 RepID=A0A6N0HQV9_9GAMM|nr:hypothetical protein [Candidatus Ruthia endofausta]QKQ24630.1 hypothetical protein HUE58_05910 [Candidatus Ruthia endofausta]